MEFNNGDYLKKLKKYFSKLKIEKIDECEERE